MKKSSRIFVRFFPASTREKEERSKLPTGSTLYEEELALISRLLWEFSSGIFPEIYSLMQRSDEDIISIADLKEIYFYNPEHDLLTDIEVKFYYNVGDERKTFSPMPTLYFNNKDQEKQFKLAKSFLNFSDGTVLPSTSRNPSSMNGIYIGIGNVKDPEYLRKIHSLIFAEMFGKTLALAVHLWGCRNGAFHAGFNISETMTDKWPVEE